jgi:hypothetical protein
MISVIKVGQTLEHGKKVTYKDFKYDYGGWADSSKYLPGDYDLCFLKTEEKTLPGWHTGISWDGLNVPENLVVKYWKRKEGE